MTLSLAKALRVSSSPSIAFIGAGGKTTAMFQLARLLNEQAKGRPVIVTATSHLGVWQAGLADAHLIAGAPLSTDQLEKQLHGVLLITGEVEGERTTPVSDETLLWLRRFCESYSVPLLIEADGSRGRPLKAWAAHEPPVPAFVELVVQVAGLQGLRQPLDERSVHRPEIFAGLSGLAPGEAVTPEAVVRVLTHPQGGRKDLPAQARKIVVLNQADTHELQSLAQSFSGSLLHSYESVVIASLRQEKVFAVHEPIAGVVLAAGESSRYGQPKQLLDWKGEPFVRAVAKTALRAGLAPVVVVSGASASEVEPAVDGLDVILTRNPGWATGQAGSIRAGIEGIRGAGAGRDAGGAIFLLADQPQVTSSVLRALQEKHAEGLHPIVAPMVMDRRANPVLFDRDTFPDLLRLEGDIGGRAIFHKYQVEYLPWHDDRLLLDVDTPEMYQRLTSDDSL